MEVNLITIKEYFTNNKTEKSIEIDGCTKIKDVNKTVDSLVYLLESRTGEKAYMPYYKTLLKIYKTTSNKQK